MVDAFLDRGQALSPTTDWTLMLPDEVGLLLPRDSDILEHHQSKAAEYNKLWRDYFIKHSNPTKAEILAYRKAIRGTFEYTC